MKEHATALLPETHRDGGGHLVPQFSARLVVVEQEPCQVGHKSNRVPEDKQQINVAEANG